MIELWGSSSPNVQKVLIALEELEAPYEVIYVNLLNHEETSPKFATLTPNRKVPLIVAATATAFEKELRLTRT